MVNVSQSTEANLFSGCIMLCLTNVFDDWYDLVYNTCKDSKDGLLEPGWECHVTLGYGYHRDDIARLCKGDIQLPISLQSIPTQSNLSFFENDKKVAKFAVRKDTPEFLSLCQLRQKTFQLCRCIETHPNYNPHITLGYFKPGTPVEAKLEYPMFNILYLKTSYKTAEGNKISCVI